MNGDIRPFRNMTDSDVPWLGNVPKHWAVPRLKTLFREIDRRSGTGEEPLLSLRMREGLVDHHGSGGKLIPPSALTHYKRTEPGELVMNRMRASAGLFAVTPSPGLVSPDYAVLRPRRELDLRYFVHLFKTPQMTSAFRLESRGLGTGESGFLRLYTERFGMLPGLLPPLDEQLAIVRFLDHADRRIRRYIRAKQKLIALLEEQKQAIIHRAVTRGLDPDVRLKPSGVAWLGDVPEHWDVVRLKVVAAEIVDCLHATPIYSDGGEFPAIRTADVQPGRLLLDSARRVDHEQYARWTSRMEPTSGDILYTREGERFGLAAAVPENVRLCISQRMMAFRIRPTHNSSYVMWQINCRHVYGQAAADLIGAAAPHVNVERIRNFWLMLPPRAEQDRIAASIEDAHARPAAAIERARAEIVLLREYRTRLIADVVTGKLDVREAAARLPDEPDDVFDESAGSMENGELDAADDVEAEEVEV